MMMMMMMSMKGVINLKQNKGDAAKAECLSISFLLLVFSHF